VSDDRGNGSDASGGGAVGDTLDGGEAVGDASDGGGAIGDTLDGAERVEEMNPETGDLETTGGVEPEPEEIYTDVRNVMTVTSRGGLER